MDVLHLLRYQTGPLATHGVLIARDLPPLATLEPPWLDDRLYVSCVRSGVYRLVPHKSPRFGHVLLLRGTQPRTHILIHAGNYAHQTEGCILPGLRRGKLKHQDAVRRSRPALNRLIKWHRQAISVFITIRWALGDETAPPANAQALARLAKEGRLVEAA